MKIRVRSSATADHTGGVDAIELMPLVDLGNRSVVKEAVNVVQITDNHSAIVNGVSAARVCNRRQNTVAEQKWNTGGETLAGHLAAVIELGSDTVAQVGDRVVDGRNERGVEQ